jgi:hypothetical protein
MKPIDYFRLYAFYAVVIVLTFSALAFILDYSLEAFIVSAAAFATAFVLYGWCRDTGTFKRAIEDIDEE